MHAGAPCSISPATPTSAPCHTTPPAIEHLDKMGIKRSPSFRAGLEQFAQILYVAPANGWDDADADRAHDRPGRLMPELRIHDLAQRHDLRMSVMRPPPRFLQRGSEKRLVIARSTATKQSPSV